MALVQLQLERFNANRMTFRELELHRTPSAGSLSNVLSSPPNLPPPPAAAAAAAAAPEMTEDATTAEPAGEGRIVELLEEPVEEMVSDAAAGSEFVSSLGQTCPCFHT